MPRGTPNTRADATATERRRRKEGSLDGNRDMKLSVPNGTNEADFEYRWINDLGNRMHQKTVQDDWDKVSGIDPVPAGTDEFGKPYFAHYCRKPKEFVEEDRKANLAGIAEREKGVIGGKKSDPQDSRSDDVSYAVAGNSLTKAYTP
jgi:hypothetical protein